MTRGQRMTLSSRPRRPRGDAFRPRAAHLGPPELARRTGETAAPGHQSRASCRLNPPDQLDAAVDLALEPDGSATATARRGTS